MERELAKCLEFDIADNDHGGLMLGGHFEYEGGGCQGLGYQVDIKFVQMFMEAFGVSRLQDVNGKSCWVTHGENGISKIEPLHKGEGTPFEIDKWPLRKKYLARKR